MAMHSTVVRCPGCDEKVRVQPRVMAVRIEGKSLVATLDAPAVTHVCGKTARPVGFAGAPKTGDGPRTTRHEHGLEPQGSTRPVPASTEGGDPSGSQE